MLRCTSHKEHIERLPEHIHSIGELRCIKEVSISRREIMLERWCWLPYVNFEGKEVFRELKKYGNRHAIFDKGAEWGYVHSDKYNATDFPIGTRDHIAKWLSEKIGINEKLARFLVSIAGLYVGYKTGKYLYKNL